jgi:uncharacterized protein (TIGR03437 family)
MRKLVILSISLVALACAETYYVNPNGGTSNQCSGTSNGPYPGTGENQSCAWAHPYWGLTGTGNWKIHGGDTLLIAPGSYPVGFGAPNTGWCTREGAFACTLPPLPSGPTPETPTRVLGAGWNSGCAVAPELWGTQRVYTIMSLNNTSNAHIACLEITDHSSCVEFHPSVSTGCERDRYPYGEWGAIGIYAAGSKNITLRNLNIHGLAHTGVQAGRLTNWTLEDVRIAGNGHAGWDGDLGPNADSSNSGTMIFRRWKVEWNGCVETWPGLRPDHCWAQSAGGYGDGVGIAASTGRWIIEDSEFRNNTSDGLDLLYLIPVRGERPSVELRRSIAAGNAGNQIKVSGTSIIVNTVVIGNCTFFLNKPFAQEMGGLHSGDHCRAYGSAVALFPAAGDSARVINSTIVGHGDTLLSAECSLRETGATSCASAEAVIQNNILVGYGDIVSDDEVGVIWDPDSLSTNHWAHNLIHRVKETPCPAGLQNVCSDPMFVNGTLETFDGHLRAGSPAIDTGLAVGSLNGLIPAEDLMGGVRPAGAGVDRGAFEYGAAPGLPAIESLASAASGRQNSLVPGSLISVYGKNLAATDRAAQSPPYPTSLGDLQVLFGQRPSSLIYASPNQINLLVPDLTPGTDTTVVIARGSLRSQALTAPVVQVAPAFFEISAGGESRPAITGTGGAIVTTWSPALRAQVLTAYVTGLGTSVPLAGSAGLRTSEVRPRVIVDGREAVVYFAGPHPTLPGLDQINFVVPDTTATAGEVRVWIEQLNRSSNIVSIPVR